MEGPLSAHRPRNPLASAHDDGGVVIVQGDKREDEDVRKHTTHIYLTKSQRSGLVGHLSGVFPKHIRKMSLDSSARLLIAEITTGSDLTIWYLLFALDVLV